MILDIRPNCCYIEVLIQELLDNQIIIRSEIDLYKFGGRLEEKTAV